MLSSLSVWSTLCGSDGRLVGRCAFEMLLSILLRFTIVVSNLLRRVWVVLDFLFVRSPIAALLLLSLISLLLSQSLCINSCHDRLVAWQRTFYGSSMRDKSIQTTVNACKFFHINNNCNNNNCLKIATSLNCWLTDCVADGCSNSVGMWGKRLRSAHLRSRRLTYE